VTLAPEVTVGAGDLQAAFLPGDAMRGVSLRHCGEELLARDIPFLHPWANRLAAWSYDVGNTHVRVAPDAPTDRNGLPIHGTVAGVPFALTHASAQRCRGELDAAREPRLMASFPFPHTVAIDVRVGASTLTITTSLRATGAVAVPVSFGFHPYFRLPGTARAHWRLRLPPRDHVALDDRQLPVASQDPEPEPEADAPIDRRTFDDHYVLGADRRFELADRRRRVTVSFGPAFDRAQVYAPPGGEFACIEPMTAAVNALVDGSAAVLAPGGHLEATWEITVTEL
jgi:galactose mutarotase-like enzyme